METSIIKLVALLTGFFLLVLLAYIQRRRLHLSWQLALLIIAVLTIMIHYSLVQFSVTTQNTLSLLNAFMLILTAAAGSTALSPEKCLAGLQKLALFITYPTIAYLLLLHLSGTGYDDVGNFDGFTDNSNVMGGYLALLMFPCVCQSYVDARVLKTRTASSIVAAIIVFLIYATASRASMLAILVGTSFVVLISDRMSTRQRAVIIICVMLSPILLSSFIQKTEDLPIFSTRLFLYELRFEAISNSPWVGWGLGADVNNTYNASNMFPPQEKGNTILQLLEEFGIVIGSAFSILITYSIIRVGRRLGGQRSLIWVPMFLVASWVHSMFETWMFNFQSLISIYFWLTFISAMFLVARFPKASTDFRVKRLGD